MPRVVRVARRRLAALIRLFFLSVFLQLAAALSTTVALAVFAQDGEGLPRMENMGKVYHEDIT